MMNDLNARFQKYLYPRVIPAKAGNQVFAALKPPELDPRPREDAGRVARRTGWGVAGNSVN